ncbi:MAG: hypothetical protein AAGF53_19445 [Pseudomonadota bacterium]
MAKEFDIRRLESAHLEQAFHLATEVFAKQSTIHRALGIDLEEYRAYLRPSFTAMVEKQLSIVASDQATGLVLGCLIWTDFYNATFANHSVPKTFSPLVALTAALSAKYNRTFGPGEVALADMAAVSAGAEGQGLYQAMRRAAEDQARRRGYRFVVSELSSAKTQHVLLRKMGHRAVAEIAFDQFEYKAMKPFKDIVDPPSLILSECTL